MDIKEAVDKRHSTREFEEKRVPDEIIKELVLQASKAPSAKNEQNYIFYSVSSDEKLKEIIVLLNKYLKEHKEEIEKMPIEFKETIKKFYKNLGGAKNIIFVYRGIKENPQNYQLFNDIVGLSCAIENLMLVAVSLDLGTCWIGSFKDKEKDISKIVGSKNAEELMAAILIGYPKKGYFPLKRDKKSLDKILKIV
jgi:nitroreductase